MLLNFFSYLIVIVILASNEILCKIHRHRLYSNDSFAFKRRRYQNNKDEYVPLNSVTLSLLYNVNKPHHTEDPKKSYQWFKLKKNDAKANYSLEKMEILKETGTSKPSVTLYQTGTNTYTTSSEVHSIGFG